MEAIERREAERAREAEEARRAAAAEAARRQRIKDALAARAMRETLDRPAHPFRTMTTLFTSPVRTGDVEVEVRVVRRGRGASHLEASVRNVGDPEPALRRLSRPDLRHLADLWLLSHPDLRDNARFRATRACVAKALRAHHGLFTGERWSMGAPGCPKSTPGDIAG